MTDAVDVTLLPVPAISMSTWMHASKEVHIFFIEMF